MKTITFLGDSLDRVRDFPDGARADVGYQLHRIQNGDEPDDWKPMGTVAPGVRELRVREDGGAFRVMYLATLPETVLVLHAFQKKTQATPQRDIELAASRLRAWRHR